MRVSTRRPVEKEPDSQETKADVSLLQNLRSSSTFATCSCSMFQLLEKTKAVTRFEPPGSVGERQFIRMVKMTKGLSTNNAMPQSSHRNALKVSIYVPNANNANG
eukprot:6200039-Pleurochrysis_carterae.AAC.2